MCMMSAPTPQLPAMPKETARSKAPDGDTVSADARRRVTDARRAASSTILTDQANITAPTTSGKTLLGA